MPPKLGEASPVEITARVILDIARGSEFPSWDDALNTLPLSSSALMAEAEKRVGVDLVWDPSAGGLHVFRGGRWQPHDMAAVRRLIARYDGMDYGTLRGNNKGYPQVRLTESIWASIETFLEVFSTRTDFFKEAPKAYAVGEWTAAPSYMSGEAGWFASEPHMRCRVGRDADVPEQPTPTDGIDPTPLLNAIRSVIRPRSGDRTTEDTYLTILLEWLGLSLIGAAPEFARGNILQGTDGPNGEGGGNGKSFLMSVFRDCFPDEMIYARDGDIELKEYMKGRLIGKRLFMVAEADASKMDIKALNGVVAGGMDEGRNAQERGSSFKYTAGVVLDCNTLPRLRSENMGGTGRRWVIIPCENDLRESKVTELDLQELRRVHTTGLVRLALASAHEVYKRRKLTAPPAEARDRLTRWLGQARPVDMWIAECLGCSPSGFVEAGDAWEHYRLWLEEGNYKCTLTRRQFGEYVNAHLPEGIRRGRSTTNRREGYASAVLLDPEAGSPPTEGVVLQMRGNPTSTPSLKPS
jgi:hypothetical protein